MGRHKNEVNVENQSENQVNLPQNEVKIEENAPILPEIEQKTDIINTNTSEFVDNLPQKPLLRTSDVASYFDVTERTVRLWIEHGHLEAIQTPRGQWRITRESVDRCRFKKKGDEA